MPKHQKPKKKPEPQEFRSGFVAIIGKPNVGKSTLVNGLVGQKVSIVTSKPQTTRNRIQGIVNRKNAQIVLIDTPGWHDAHNLLGRQMLSEIVEAIEGVDVLALMADANSGIGVDNDGILQRAAEFKGPAVLLLNKIDRIPKEKLLPLIADFSKLRDFAAIVPISALTGDGVEEVLSEIIRVLPEGHPLFPTDQFTDQPERFLAGEIVREKVMALTKQEIPHSVAVLVDTFEESPALIRIGATIYVEREGQKGIVIGKGGAMLKSVGTQARVELESILGTKVFLELYVKTQPEWRNSASIVKQLDWHAQIEKLGENESEDNDTP